MRNDGNVPGRFYVDAGCAKCDYCLRVAPRNFRRGETQNFVSRQPNEADEKEMKRFTDAYHSCPSSAIRDREKGE